MIQWLEVCNSSNNNSNHPQVLLQSLLRRWKQSTDLSLSDSQNRELLRPILHVTRMRKWPQISYLKLVPRMKMLPHRTPLLLHKLRQFLNSHQMHNQLRLNRSNNNNNQMLSSNKSNSRQLKIITINSHQRTTIMKAGTQMLEEKVADKDHPLHETRCD